MAPLISVCAEPRTSRARAGKYMQTCSQAVGMKIDHTLRLWDLTIKRGYYMMLSIYLSIYI